MNKNSNGTDKVIFKLYNPFSQFDSVKEIWTSMLNKCPHEYYLSWAWNELWIRSLPADIGLYFVVGFANDTPVITFFAGSQTRIRHKFLKFRELSLNSTLNPHYDLIWIEYNAILIDPQIKISLRSLLDHIPLKWDEFRMTRCAPIYQPNLLITENMGKDYNLIITDLKSHYVDLDKVRRNNNDYLALISPKKRYQIRRSIKEYEKMGELRIDVAENVQEALKIFNELIQIHQNRWTESGQPGSFSNEYYVDFHKKLISGRFEHGEIQLIRISAGNHAIGCLYCFIYDGKVLGYICGFNYLPGYLYSPGLVSHYFAIMHNARVGYSCYDFLEGDDPYKKSLATDHNEMQHIRIQKRNMKYKIERVIIKLSRLFQKKGTDLMSKE